MAGNPSHDRYTPIKDYAIIGDCHCAALVSKTGSMDWLCLPRFDSPAVFCALLDFELGGRFKICPQGDYSSEQRYIDGTNVLQTEFRTAGGCLLLTDLMPIAASADRSLNLFPQRHVLRVIECLEGEAEVQVDFTPRLDYGRVIPRLENRGRMGLFCEDRGRVLNLRTSYDLDISVQRCSATGLVLLKKGERFHFSLAFTEGEPAVLPPLGEEADLRVRTTIEWWKDWSSRCCYEGPYRRSVIRSALTLKLMTYAPSGAVIAAPTTSLPERIGGVRNWDYRYCWLRDASMTLHALYKIGYTEEAEAFLSWLIHSTRLSRPELQVLYDVYGETSLEEHRLDALEGYAGSRPARVGNGASTQLQLDVYGEVVDGVFAFVKWGRGVDRTTAGLLRGFGETVCNRWREPDEGIWEVRAEPKHFTFSKVMCWVALDRLIRMHEAGQLKVDVGKFIEEREAIRSEIEDRGFSRAIRSYTVTYDSEAVDVSLLLLPIFGYVEAGDSRMRSTIDRIREELGENGLLYRYSSDFDGLPPGEGAFAIASFWAVECLARQGEYAEASQTFEHLLSLASPTGLFGEEIDPQTGAALGNFPQAYTHVGLINAALALAEAKKGFAAD